MELQACGFASLDQHVHGCLHYILTVFLNCILLLLHVFPLLKDAL